MKFVLGFMVMLVCVQICEQMLFSKIMDISIRPRPRRTHGHRVIIHRNRSDSPRCVFYHSVKCGGGWLRFSRRRCMKIFAKANFKTAKFVCRRNGAKVVSVHNARQNRELTCLTYQHFRRRVQAWIGATREGHGWRWSDHSRFSYTSWMKGEPNNWRTSECTTTNYKRYGMWADTPCGKRYHVVCVKG
ncbi:galactose-specific lectin nattectin-like [Genypterus blacodes]|uniref:galactose-specific lectin nattectin-like n=1 Tax=Genypterus blacodes TaxID=154954 RepID=UPI003F764F62